MKKVCTGSVFRKTKYTTLSLK